MKLTLNQRTATESFIAMSHDGYITRVEPGELLQEPFLRDDQVFFHRSTFKEELHVPVSRWAQWTADQPFSFLLDMEVTFSTWSDFLTHKPKHMEVFVQAFNEHERMICAGDRIIEINDANFGIEKIKSSHGYQTSHAERVAQGKPDDRGPVVIAARLY
jgi:hypothetical protein